MICDALVNEQSPSFNLLILIKEDGKPWLVFTPLSYEGIGEKQASCFSVIIML